MGAQTSTEIHKVGDLMTRHRAYIASDSSGSDLSDPVDFQEMRELATKMERELLMNYRHLDLAQLYLATRKKFIDSNENEKEDTDAKEKAEADAERMRLYQAFQTDSIRDIKTYLLPHITSEERKKIEPDLDISKSRGEPSIIELEMMILSYRFQIISLNKYIRLIRGSKSMDELLQSYDEKDDFTHRSAKEDVLSYHVLGREPISDNTIQYWLSTML